MDHSKILTQTLSFIPGPAFAAKDGVITHCNAAAEQLLTPGTALEQILSNNTDDYKTLTDGCLYLSLTISDTTWGASVIPMGEHQLFRMEPLGMTPELKAISLLGSQLRLPLTNLSIMTDGIRTPEINRELANILRILNNISNAERFTTGLPRMRQQDICAVMKELLQECAQLLYEAEILLRYTVPETPVYMEVDQQMIRHAVYAVIDNAAMQTATGGTIVAEFTVNDRQARLSITDHGSGISNEVMGTLFNRYTRQPGIEESFRNLGLGMTLVRAATFAHGGGILIEKLGTKGTRVSLTLSINHQKPSTLRSPLVNIVPSADDAHIMLSNVLPAKLYQP